MLSVKYNVISGFIYGDKTHEEMAIDDKPLIICISFLFVSFSQVSVGQRSSYCLRIYGISALRSKILIVSQHFFGSVLLENPDWYSKTHKEMIKAIGRQFWGKREELSVGYIDMCMKDN